MSGTDVGRGSTADRNRRRRRSTAFATAWLALLLALTAGAAAHAATRDTEPAGNEPPPPTREHGKGDWFRDVCARPQGEATGCNASVVSDAAGAPLASTTPPASAYGPAAFHTAYGLPTTAPGATAPTIAIVDAYDDPSIESDLAVYDTTYGLPACTTANGCFRKVDQNGGTAYPAGTSWHLEIALDVETAHQICQNCRILLVEAKSNSLADLGTAVNTAVALGANVVSNSYGAGEFSTQTTYEAAYFKHPGVVITASAGDSGYGVEFPAASQYVTAVGGTTLLLNADKSYKSESVWSGTGSGCSSYEPKPAWQIDAGCSRRTVADVSADADPNTGAAIFDSVGTTGGAGWYQVGGTSLSAPLVGAVYALTGNTNVNYGATPYSQPGSLRDVTTGSNGTCAGSYLCTAGAGFDGPTGLGSPNGLLGFTAGPVTPDFAVSVAPASASVAPTGGTATYTVTVTPTGGFSSAVTLSTSGLPVGATPAFSPAATSSGASTLTVSTTGSVPSGSYPFSIVGTAGALSHAVAATLVVASPASLTASPTSVSRRSNVSVSWSNVATASPTDWIGLYVPGAANSARISWLYDNRCSQRAGSTAVSSGRCTFSMPGTSGTYEFRLFSGSGALIAKSNTVTVR